jgi:phosphohistidine phosphatase SixA
MRFFISAILCGLLLVSEVAHSQGMIFLVRHAERLSSADDSLLSTAGEQRARCLANTLKDAHISAIFATDVKRTQQTAAPVASEFNIQTRIIPKANSAELVKQIEQSDRQPVLVVGHADTLLGIVQQLGAGNMSKFGDREYDRLIVVPVVNGKAQPFTVLRYCFGTSRPAGVDRSMR